MLEKYEKLSKDAETRTEKAKARMALAKNNELDNDKIKSDEVNISDVLIEPINDQISNENLSFKPIIKLNSMMSASKESSETINTKTQRKLIEGITHSTETSDKNLDEEIKKRLDVFKTKNTHGHSSDSSVQNVIYPENLGNEEFPQQQIIERTNKQEMELSSISPTKTHIKRVEGSHPSDETSDTAVDEEMKKRLDVFKTKNTHGHSSDSSVQNLLYPIKELQSKTEKVLNTSNMQTGNESFDFGDKTQLDEANHRLDVFKKRNNHGHSSDSTVQNLLYTQTTEKINARIQEKSAEESKKLKEQIEDQKSKEDDKDSIEKNIQVFKNRNYLGHSSDSTIQNLLYNEDLLPKKNLNNNKTIAGVELIKKPINSIDQYISNLNQNSANKRKIEKKEFNNNIFEQKLLIEEQREPANLFKTSIRMNKTMHATKSTIEKKIFDPELYKSEYNYDEDDTKAKSRLNWGSKKYDWNEIFADCVKPYDDDFNMEFNSIMYDNILLETQRNTLVYDEEFFESSTDHEENDVIISESNDNNSPILFAFNYINLDKILMRLLQRPIEIQTNFVNKCLINYFFQKLNIESHFVALRKYFLFEDSEFAFTFVNYLCSKFFSSSDQQQPVYNRKLKIIEIFNPININEALNIAKSSIKNCKFIDNLSIGINEENYSSDQLQDVSLNKSGNEYSNLNSSCLQYCSEILGYFNNLELKYTIDWPLNIVITDLCMKKYNQVFCFLLQIKFCHLTLNNIWLSLKRIGNLSVTITFQKA